MAGFPGSLWNKDRQLWGALCQENRSINPLLVTHQMDSVGRRSYLFIYTQGWNVSRREKWGPGNAAQRAMGVPSLERIPDWMRFWAAWTNVRVLEWEIFRHPSKQFHDSVNPSEPTGSAPKPKLAQGEPLPIEFCANSGGEVPSLASEECCICKFLCSTPVGMLLAGRIRCFAYLCPSGADSGCSLFQPRKRMSWYSPLLPLLKAQRYVLRTITLFRLVPRTKMPAHCFPHSHLCLDLFS